MKRLTITLIAALFCVSQAAFAQVDASPATSAAQSAMSQLEALNAKVADLKAKAQAEFEAEQSEIDATKQELAAKRTAIEAKNDQEKDMMADVWPSRVSEREALVKAEQANRLRQQKLNLRKKDFEVKVAQIEQKIKSSFVESLKMSLDTYNQGMSAYGTELDGVKY